MLLLAVVVVESTSLKPFVCFSVLAAVTAADLTLLLLIMLLMKISFINISAVVEVKVGVVGLLGATVGSFLLHLVGDKDPEVADNIEEEFRVGCIVVVGEFKRVHFVVFADDWEECDGLLLFVMVLEQEEAENVVEAWLLLF